MQKRWGVRSIVLGVIVLSFPLLPTRGLAETPSVEAIFQEISTRLSRVNPDPQIPFTAEEVRDLNEVNRLRKPFLRARAKKEGVLLQGVKSTSVLDTLMMLCYHCREHGQTQNLEHLERIIAKFATMKGQIVFHLESISQARLSIRHPSLQSFLADSKGIERIIRRGDINYEAYFKLVQKMAACFDPQSKTFENQIYEKAKALHESYQTHEEVWLEVIRATDTEQGEYTQGLRELLRRGYFGRPEAMRYIVTESYPAHMVRSMMHFYVMRLFSELYLSVYHSSSGRLETYVKSVLTDPAMHLHIFTFSYAAEKTREAFNQSSSFRRLGVRHPIWARALIDAGPLFTGMIVADSLFMMVGHPRFGEVLWLSRQGEIKAAAGLFIDLTEDVWLRKTFLMRVLFSTAVFTGYNLSLYSGLHVGGLALNRFFSNYTARPFFTRTSFSPLSSFLVFSTAFIVHDLLMEKVTPTFVTWDWEARIAKAKELVSEKMNRLKEEELFQVAENVLKELGLKDFLHSDELLNLIFQKNLSAYLETEGLLTPETRFDIDQLEKGALTISLHEVGREFEKLALEEKSLKPTSRKYPMTSYLLREASSLFSLFELLNQSVEGYQEFLFADMTRLLYRAQEAYTEERKELISFYEKASREAAERENIDLASSLMIELSQAQERLSHSLLSDQDEELFKHLKRLNEKDQAQLRFRVKQMIRACFYPTEIQWESQSLEMGSWMAIVTDHVSFLASQWKKAPFLGLRRLIETQMIHTFLEAEFRRYQISEAGRLGMKGWVSGKLTDAQKIETVETLRSLDPELRSPTIRQLLSQ